jgi:hypothetical protein
MPHGRLSELSVGMAVVGYLIEQPATPACLAKRLAEDMPAAKFARSAVNNALTRLQASGCVRLVNEDAEVYEAMPEGMRRFRSWLRSSGGGPPPIREPLHGKLMLSQPEERDRLIVITKGEERACAREYRATRSRLATVKLENHGHPKVPAQWSNLVRQVVIFDEVMMWQTRFKRLKYLRKMLEALDSVT